MAAPPKKGMPAWGIVLIVIACLVLPLLLLILAGVGVFAVGNSTDNAAISACNTERSAIVTAYAAAASANQVGADESATDYLADPFSMRYFEMPSGVVAEPIARLRVSNVSAEDCPPIRLDELPPGAR